MGFTRVLIYDWYADNWTPFLAISSNTHKVESLISDIGISKERLVRDVKDIDEKMNKLNSFSDEEIESISKYLKLANIKIDEMFDEISALSNLSNN